MATEGSASPQSVCPRPEASKSLLARTAKCLLKCMQRLRAAGARYPQHVRQGDTIMPLVPMRLLLDHAAENDYGLAAFNVNNMEQIQAIMEAARETESPVIVQASRGARSYSQDNYLRHLMLAAAELYPEIPISMHQDHGNSPATCKSAIDNGFTSVMMDGSLKEDGKTPADFDYNVQVTKEVCEAGPCQRRLGRRRARLPGLARIGPRRKGRRPRCEGSVARPVAHRSGRSRAVRRRNGSRCPGRRHRHQPRRVQVHPQAHGEVLAMDRIEEIHRRLPNCHLVMHGSALLTKLRSATRLDGAEAIIMQSNCARRTCSRSLRGGEVDSNLQPSGCKAPNIPLHHRAPRTCTCFFTWSRPSDGI